MTELNVHEFENSLEAVKIAVKASNPFVWVRTHEEDRFIETFVDEVAKKGALEVLVWSCGQGLVPPDIYRDKTYQESVAPYDKTKRVDKLLDALQNMEPTGQSSKGMVVILRDPGPIFQVEPTRRFKDMKRHFINRKVTILCVSHEMSHGSGGNKPGLAPSMEKDFTVIDYDLPTLTEIRVFIKGLIDETYKKNKELKKKSNKKNERIEQLLKNYDSYVNEDYDSFAKALQGLTRKEINTAATSCIHKCLGYNIEFLVNAKRQIISKSDILDFITNTQSMENIGGLDLAKEFFDDYKFAHTAEAQEFGVEPLKGILLVGIPGCGKSALCKAVPISWKLPLIRMDVGKVMTGLVGGSESRMREAIKQVEAISPCILWIDEVEKALSGTKSSGFSDGGTTARVFGTLLTAMEEGMKGVTILATANDISALPPEFKRRFDEIFFVDLPGPKERESIFHIHLNKRKRKTDDIDFESLVQKTDRFTGSEIERAVKRAITFSFNDTDKVIKTEHLMKAVEETKPLADVEHDALTNMRAQAEGRFRYASSWAQDKGKKKQEASDAISVDDIEMDIA